MKISQFLVNSQGDYDPLEALADAIGQAKSAVADILVNSNLRKLPQDSPFLALGINQGQWETMPAAWRKKVRLAWRNTVDARKDLPDLADRLTVQLDDFLAKVEALPASDMEDDEGELADEVTQNKPPNE